MHGGAPGSGAPWGNKNAVRHGWYEADTVRTARKLRKMVKRARILMAHAFRPSNNKP